VVLERSGGRSVIGDRHGVVGGGETFRKRGEARSGFDTAS
jgi:hypothetical protein